MIAMQSAITPKTFKRTKSKTKTQNITASSKRKLDEYDADVDTYYNEPNNKKMKFNENNTDNKQNTALFESNCSLKKENSELIKERDHYKQECNKWKSKYTTLFSKLCKLTEVEVKSLALGLNDNNMSYDESVSDNSSMEHNDNDNHTTKYEKIQARLLEMGFDKNQVINRISSFHGSGETAQFVFTQIINTFTRQLRSNTNTITNTKRNTNMKNMNESDSESESDSDVSSNNDSESSYNMCDEMDGHDINKNNHKLHHSKIKTSKKYVTFENSYHFSINCYICDKHFDAFNVYRDHIKLHYQNHPNKTWKKCEFGCKTTNKGDDCSFIGHIATHSNTKPFHCDVLVDGGKCGASLSRKAFLKDHWKRHFIQLQTDKHKHKNNAAAKHADFEDNYHISVHCHICKMHFDDIYEYKSHLQRHYAMDSTKTWRRCDFGCSEQFINSMQFISHLANQHTKEKPFRCDAVTNGVKCEAKLCRKFDILQHLKRHFNHQNVNKSKQSKQSKVTAAKAMASVNFEDSYYVSVNCHLCKKHFDDFCKYGEHIKQHYEKDPLRTWLQCDFGCSVGRQQPLFSSSYGFMYHIASHTKQLPFKCNLRIDGHKCKGVAPLKSDLKKHWNRNHNVKALKNQNKNVSNDNNSDSDQSSSCFESESDDSDDEYIDFEESYIFSVECHICSTYFDDFCKYRDHIKKHYVNDRDRNWMECDFGCTNKNDSSIPVVSSNSSNFITHIAMHSKQRPYKCVISVNGIKCARTSTTKCDIKNHWKLNHFKEKSDDKYRE